jgi:hypothetical protein
MTSKILIVRKQAIENGQYGLRDKHTVDITMETAMDGKCSNFTTQLQAVREIAKQSLVT